MYKNVISKLKTNVLNIPGWRTDRKIIVIESDDWGSIRTTSNNVLQKIAASYNIELHPYVLYDSLESEEDLIALFDLLKSIRNRENENPIVTANCLVANPDFYKIKKSNYSEYHYKLISDTFSSYPKSTRCLNLWKEGKHEKLFKPQFHGREHLNVQLWLNQLKTDAMTIEMFDNEFWGIVKKGELDFVKKNSMAACNFTTQKELEFVQNSLIEGLKHFESLFGYKSKSYIANNYIWDGNIEDTVHEMGVSYIQGQSFQIYPALTRKILKKEGKRNFLGQSNKNRQLYLTRNCFFEPCTDKSFDESILKCFCQVESAFRWNKPAIISSHRVNYIGGLSLKNRQNGLSKLKKLLELILKKYPSVEFMTSDELGNLIQSSK